MTEQQERNPRTKENYLWDSFVEDGQEFEISDPAPEEEGMRVLVFEKAGTSVMIVSDLPRSEMVRIALSMEPIDSAR